MASACVRPWPQDPFTYERNGWTMERTRYIASEQIMEVVVTHPKYAPSVEAGAAVIMCTVAAWPDIFHEIRTNMMLP